MARKWVDTWQGGRIFKSRSGETGWVLQRMVNGERFSKTLDVTSEKDALAELALFDRDPVKYVTPTEEAREAGVGAIVVNADTTAQVLAHLKKNDRDKRYVASVIKYLATWGEDLEGKDLRKVRIDELKRLLAKHETARPKRIAALKTFTAFFRTELNTLPVNEDPTIALMSIQTLPEKLQREKGHTIEAVQKVYASTYNWESELIDHALGRFRMRGCTVGKNRSGWGDVQGVRDVLVLRCKLGMHMSEVNRLTSGKAIIKPVSGHGEIRGTLRFTHKRGNDHVVSLDAQGLAAAQRLLVRGSPINDSFMRTTVRLASAKAGLKIPMALGELRHSFITWAKEKGREVRPKTGGVPIELVSAVVGHLGSTTTKSNYLGSHVPSMIAVPLKLQHPDDPKPKLKLVSSAG